VQTLTVFDVPQLTAKSRYCSFITKVHYDIRDIYSCDTTCTIYLLECKKCNKKYVGETGTTVGSRVKHHRNTTKANISRPIYPHIQSHNKTFDMFTITIIDRVTNLKERKEKEMEYITLLKTYIPFGLNVIKKE